MGNGKAGERRIKHRERKAEAARRQLPWAPPPLEECDPEEQSDWPLDLENRLIMRRWTRDGRLVDFALVHEAKDDHGNWAQVAEIDCKHGEVHKHQRYLYSDGPGRRTVIKEIRDQSDIEESFDPALNDISDNYEEHLRRWRQ